VGLQAALGLFGASYGQASAQLIDRYFPANVPAYQEWAVSAAPQEADGAYGPLGVRVGGFTISPSLTEGVGYDSDPTGLSNGAGSAVIDDSASVVINSDWSRNAVNAAFTVNRQDYLSDPHQSYTTWAATVGGVFDYADDRILAGYSHVYGVSLPTDVGSFGVTQPIVSQVDDFRLSDTIGQGRITLVPALVADLYGYSGEPGVNRADALFDRDALTTSLTAGYEFGGGHNVLMVVSNTLAAYNGGDAALRPAGYDDLSVMAGLEYRQSALIIYRALVGYEERSPTGHGTNSTSVAAPAAELDVIWKPSVLTSVTGKISQSLQDGPTDNAQGLNETSVQLAIAESLRRDVMLTASAQYMTAAFSTSSQTQSVITLNGDATWSLDRNIALSLSYIFNRSSDDGNASARFTRQQVMLQVRFQL
jgi:hypothetical protein